MAEITIKNEEFASNLIALALMCAENGTDNCDVQVTTSKGKINCNIEFSEVLEDGSENNHHASNT